MNWATLILLGGILSGCAGQAPSESAVAGNDSVVSWKNIGDSCDFNLECKKSICFAAVCMPTQGLQTTIRGTLVEVPSRSPVGGLSVKLEPIQYVQDALGPVQDAIATTTSDTDGSFELAAGVINPGSLQGSSDTPLQYKVAVGDADYGFFLDLGDSAIDVGVWGSLASHLPTVKASGGTLLIDLGLLQAPAPQS
jgi:hypothetical protein